MCSQEKWQMISAIGQILGVFLTLVVGCIALIPYMRKCRVYFCLMRNMDKKPTFVIVNTSQKGQFLNKIVLYSGRFAKKPMCDIDMLDIQDDLLVEKRDFFIPPNSYIKIPVNATRIIHALTHGDVAIQKDKNVFIKLDFGNTYSRKYNTRIITCDFIRNMLSVSEAYQNYPIELFWR